MRQRFRRYLETLILLIGISIILTNCQKDNDFNLDSISITKPILNDLNYKEFINQKNSRLTLEKMNELNETTFKNSSNYNKDLSEQPESITIDSSSIKQVIINGSVSYTFRIVPDTINLNYFENLIIQTDSLQETKAYIIKYIPEIETEYDINAPFVGAREITPIDSDININTSNKTTVCVTVTTYYHHYLCDAGVEQTVENCDYQYTEEVNDTTCTTLDGGGGNGINTFYIPTGGGGGNGTPPNNNDPDFDPSDPDNHNNTINNDPIYTSPNNDENGIHKKSLLAQANNQKIKNKIIALKSVVNSTLSEDGMQFDFIANSDPVDYDEVEPIEDESGTDHIKFPDTRINTLVNLHLHPKYGLIEGIAAPQELSPIFSDGDVAFFLKMFNDTNNNEDISSIIVSSEGVFALRVTDAARANLMNNKLSIKRFWKKYLKSFRDEVLDTPDGVPAYTNQEIIANFVTFLSTYQFNNNDDGMGFGLSLFQATIDSNGNITGWIQP